MCKLAALYHACSLLFPFLAFSAHSKTHCSGKETQVQNQVPFLVLGTSLVAFSEAADNCKHTSTCRICNGMPAERLNEHMLGQLPAYTSLSHC